MNEYINKEDALNCFHDWVDKYGDVHTPDEMAEYRAIEALPSVQRIPWDKNTRNSMVNTLQTLYRLAYNIHGVMDVIDDDNANRLIEWLKGGET